MVKLVQGVGFNDGKYSATEGGENTREYQLWLSMLSRCYCRRTQARQPTYVGCTVSENFKSFSFFYEWLQNKIGFSQRDYVLDKDLLIKANQVYSETTCVLIPHVLNSLFISCKKVRGAYPIGVNLCGNRFQSRLNFLGRRKLLGYFKTPEEAFQAYKTAKEAHVKYMAELYRDQVDIRVYNALMAYQVEITD